MPVREGGSFPAGLRGVLRRWHLVWNLEDRQDLKWRSEKGKTSNSEPRMLEKSNWPGGWKQETTEVREEEGLERLPGRQCGRLTESQKYLHIRSFLSTLWLDRKSGRRMPMSFTEMLKSSGVGGRASPQALTPGRLEGLSPKCLICSRVLNRF